MRSDYASPDSLSKIEKQLKNEPGVEGIALPDSTLVEAMNRNIERFTMILGAIALIMIVISFVLINNTVHLAIYARRFTIHTMQLVGATNAFIRRPFVNNNMLSGFLAGCIASCLICAAVVAAPQAGLSNVTDYIGWNIIGLLIVSLILMGVLLCGLAAWIATSHYLKQDYDELFR